MELCCSVLDIRLRKEFVSRNCLTLILLFIGGIGPSILDSQGLGTFAVEHLGGLLVIVKASQSFSAGPTQGSGARPRIISRVTSR